MRVKICGITNPGDALAAARAGADFVGLILAPSSRQVSAEAAKEIVAALSAPAAPVLVFRDAPMDAVLAALETTGAGCAQLHGAEPVNYLAELQRRRPKIRLIKAWEVSADDAWEQSADLLIDFVRDARDTGVGLPIVLLDAPKGGPHPGYERMAACAARCHTLPVQVWCAGGLTPDNVAIALACGQFDGADVAGGVEVRPGVKDHAAIRRFIENARGAAPPTRAP
jgi:phosphoribosylanthranilate isomerase